MTTRENYLQYIIRRFFRLFPVYLICLSLAIYLGPRVAETLAGWQPDPTYLEGATRLVDSPTQNFFAHWIAHLSMLHGVLPDSIFAGLGNYVFNSCVECFSRMAILFACSVRNSSS